MKLQDLEQKGLGRYDAAPGFALTRCRNGSGPRRPGRKIRAGFNDTPNMVTLQVYPRIL